ARASRRASRSRRRAAWACATRASGCAGCTAIAATWSSRPPTSSPPRRSSCRCAPRSKLADRRRVVLADDEPLGRLALRQLLARHRDLELVGEACDGRDAVALVEQARPDVL